MRVSHGWQRLQRCCGSLPRLLWARGLQFEEPAMEAAFQAKESRYVVSFTHYWVLLHIFITAIVLVLRCYRFGWSPNLVFYTNFLPFGIIGLLFLAIRVSYFKPRTYQLLCLTNLFMMAWTAWSVHLVVELELSFMETSTLDDVYAAIQDPGAAETLRAFTAREVSRKYLWNAMVMDFLLLDLLQFLGLRWESVVVFAALPASLGVLSYTSPVLSRNILEVFVTSAIVMLFTIFISLRVSQGRRSQFELDHKLHTSLESEAAALKEAAERELALKEASQEADTILNHMLKNVMADAAGCIHLHLQGLSSSLLAPPPDLVLATECLERGVAWCRKRQAILRVASGKYTPQRVEVDVVQFGQSLLQGRPIHAEFPAVTATFDPLLCEIVLENALTNACRHCDPTHPGLCFMASLSPVDAFRDANDNRRHMKFVVMNRANPCRPPVTKELAARLLQGEELPLGPDAPRLSEHLGMQHLCQAARVHGMELNLFQAGDLVHFEAVLEVTVRAEGSTDSSRTVLSPVVVPPNLQVFCVDDSAVARRLLTHILSKEPFKAEVFAFGHCAEDVPQFLEQAARQAHIVVLDYYLDYGHVSFLGTDLLRDLLDRGYSGLACIRSANASPYDEALYARAGAHCCIGKDVDPKAMAATLMAAYQRLHAQRLALRTPLTEEWPELETETTHPEATHRATHLPGMVHHPGLSASCSTIELPLLLGHQPPPPLSP